MTPESMFHQMLGLGTEWKVSSCRFDPETGLVTLHIQETDQLWQSYRCPHDQGEAFCYDHTEELVWRHLNVFEHKCEIHCRLPRARCRTCSKTLRVEPPWEGKSKHFTRDFEAFALTLMREMPVKKAAEILGETDKRLWRMLFLHVEEAYRKLEMDGVVWVGADEMNRRKGHNYLTVFADLKARRVIFATEGKDASTWEAFVDELLKHNGHPKAILQAAIDMSPAYIKGVRENLGNAEIVCDKFHVVREVNEAVEKVRRLETQAGGEAQSWLKRTQWIWRKNPENWTDSEALRTVELEKQHLLTATAYRMRLVLQGIYQCGREGAARREFKRWCEWVSRECDKKGREALQPMRKAAQMIESHLEGILGHWSKGLTTAFLEGLNSLFSATKRKARGYKSIHYLKAMLYFVSGKLNIPA